MSVGRTTSTSLICASSDNTLRGSSPRPARLHCSPVFARGRTIGSRQGCARVLDLLVDATPDGSADLTSECESILSFGQLNVCLPQLFVCPVGHVSSEKIAAITELMPIGGGLYSLPLDLRIAFQLVIIFGYDFDFKQVSGFCVLSKQVTDLSRDQQWVSILLLTPLSHSG